MQNRRMLHVYNWLNIERLENRLYIFCIKISIVSFKGLLVKKLSTVNEINMQLLRLFECNI